MFDKVKWAGLAGAASAAVLTFLERTTALSFPQGTSLESAITQTIVWAIPGLVAFAAGYLKRERTGYGSGSTKV